MLLITNPKIDITSKFYEEILNSVNTGLVTEIDLTLNNSSTVYIGTIDKCLACGLQGERVLGFQKKDKSGSLALYYLHKLQNINNYYYRATKYCFISLSDKQLEAFDLSAKEKLYLPRFIEFDYSPETKALTLDYLNNFKTEE